MAGKFVLKKGSTGKFHFNLVAGNGQVIATSEAYESKASALNGIKSVQTNAPSAEIDDQTADLRPLPSLARFRYRGSDNGPAAGRVSRARRPDLQPQKRPPLVRQYAHPRPSRPCAIASPPRRELFPVILTWASAARRPSKG